MHNTDAHALQEILQSVNNPATGATVRARWEVVLGATESKQAKEFVTRHSEVVSLLVSTIHHIRALPEHQQARYEASITQWWIAVTSPDQHWGNKHDSMLIGQEHINLLGSLGDVIEVRMAGTSAAPEGRHVEDIKAQCDEWLSSINEFGLPDNLQRLITEGLNHLLWLIDNQERFGFARVAQAAENVTGQLVTAAVEVPEAARPRWKARLNRWAGAILTFSRLAGATHLALKHGTDVINDIEPALNAVKDVVEEIDTPDGSQ